MGHLFVGIDPGMTGGFAVLSFGNGCGENGRLLDVKPIPVFKGRVKKILGGLSTKKVEKDRYDVEGIVELVAFWAAKGARFIVEAQQAMPAHVRHSAAAEFKLGYGYGLIYGAVMALSGTISTVHPRDWQFQAFQDLDSQLDTKKRSVLAAEAIWGAGPFRRSRKARKSHHGLTDAALIGLYGAKVSKSC